MKSLQLPDGHSIMVGHRGALSDYGKLGPSRPTTVTGCTDTYVDPVILPLLTVMP